MAWYGDNRGPSDGLAGALTGLRKRFPAAYVHSSSFTAFFQEASKPENKAKLPVVTAEIGDAWIYGVPSDPLKCAQFRAVARVRDECLSSGACVLADLKSFDRMLVKIPEHVTTSKQSPAAYSG